MWRDPVTGPGAQSRVTDCHMCVQRWQEHAQAAREGSQPTASTPGHPGHPAKRHALGQLVLSQSHWGPPDGQAAGAGRSARHLQTSRSSSHSLTAHPATARASFGPQRQRGALQSALHASHAPSSALALAQHVLPAAHTAHRAAGHA
ncbi:hypothetical protein TREES_T100014928 [Tupaia chinensis]|uniref:Uncharacterized protein n=1 Tax=Tupaia chinensis TaxID=246437 RepID=L9KUH7_TUPCH|nr:hypothetical protein TREES_T100014928 [Tupaia chinensis]